MKQYVSNKFAVVIAVVLVALATMMGVSAFLVLRPPPTATNACTYMLRRVDEAKRQWAVDYGKGNNDIPTWEDIWPYLNRGIEVEIPICPIGAKEHVLVRVGQRQECPTSGSVH